MLGFLFVADDALVVEDDARGALKDTAAQVLDAATEALTALPADGFGTEAVQEALQTALVDGLGIKPRFAFTPLRVAVSGRRVSPLTACRRSIWSCSLTTTMTISTWKPSVNW